MKDSPYDRQREDMLRRQLRQRGIADPRVLAAMAHIPRDRFVDPLRRREAYADRALPIDCGQTISQPYMVALMTEALALQGDERVLEIGTGSGYQTAILAALAAEVMSMERHAELSRQAAARLADLGIGNVRFLVGDGTLGWPALGPYERIVVTAAAPEPPPALLEQLAEGGRLVIPCGTTEEQMLQLVTRTGQQFPTTDLAPCRFVPLLGAQGWPGA